MEFNIVEEVYKLKNNLLRVVNGNPLPTTIKLMIVNELASAMKAAEINELKSMKEKEKPISDTKNAEKEG